ncbi:MAG: polysaccharide biosynthesis/export family protein [Pseudomonas sp.]|uniref:polysaccharide biosynthesis/export family protein n=1 Tax=Pseudomonas sp. TaxID=306 RepID=UPI00339B4D3C
MIRLVFCSLLTLCLNACSTPATVALPDDQSLDARHRAIRGLADLPPAEVRVQAGDTLRIVRDAQEPNEQDDMSLFVVRPDGYFSLPHLGLIKADGRTPEDLAREITDKRRQLYREPNTTVNIAIAPSNRVFIGGAVANPALFELAGPTSVEQALIGAGGVLPSADSRNVALLRPGGDGKYQVYFFDFAALLRTPDRPLVRLQRGDILYVPKSGLGNAVEAVDMYVTRLIPINKGIGVGFNYDLNDPDIDNDTQLTPINPVGTP